MHVMNGHDRNLGNVAGRLIAWFLPYSSLETECRSNTFSDEMTTVRKKHAKLLKFLFVDERSSDHHPFVQNQIRSEENSCDPHHVFETKLRPYQLKVYHGCELTRFRIAWTSMRRHGSWKNNTNSKRHSRKVVERSKSNDVTVRANTIARIMPRISGGHWKSEISEHFKDILIPVSCFQITKDIKEFMSPSCYYNVIWIIRIMSHYQRFFERWYYVVLDEGM